MTSSGDQETSRQATIRVDMIPFIIILLATFGLLVAEYYLARRRRAKLLARIRAEWGQPRERVRRMADIAEYHHSRQGDVGPDASLDDRTWSDLHLDEVFGMLDRTESPLGQQALYHRLVDRALNRAAELDRLRAGASDRRR